MNNNKPAGVSVLLAASVALLITGLRANAQDDPPAPNPAGQDQEAEAHEQTVPAGSLDEAVVHDDLEDLDLLDLKIPVVVTAARREQKITGVPQAVSIITTDDIRRSGARSVPDMFRLVPGLDVADLSFKTSAVSPRAFTGFLANQVLVLVDGRQIYDSVFGGTLWGSWPFQIEDIDRVEVIRGPGGVTWGANAVNGVINIITKDPRDQLGLSVTLGGGSRGTFKKHIGYGFEDRNLRLRISGEYEASDGFRSGGSMLRGLEDEYKTGRIGLHAVYEGSPNDTVTFSAGSAVLDGGLPPPPSGLLMDRRNSGSQASFMLGKWRHSFTQDNRIDLTGYVNDFHVSNGVSSVDYRYQQLALQFGHTFKAGDTHVLIWGIDTRLDLVDTTNADPFMLSRGSVSTVVAGAYIEDEWLLADQWTLNLGSRIEYDSYGGFEPSARAALSYQLTDDTLIYGAVSRSFHMWPGAARFLDIPLAGGLVRVQSDRAIRPPTVVAYELGQRGSYLDKSLRFSVDLFWHEYSDAYTLSPQLGPPGLLRIDIDNRASASLYGVEVEARYTVSKTLTLLGHYTYEQLRWTSLSPIHEKDMMTPPKHKCMIGVRYSPTDDLHLSGHLFYVDAVKAPDPANPFVPRNVDPYLRLDLFGEYEFWNDRASIAAGVQNLLDPEHYEGGSQFINDAEVPRMIYAELRFAIK